MRRETVIVSKTKYVATLLTERNIDFDGQYVIGARNERKLRVFKLKDNLKEYFIAGSFYLLSLVIILIVGYHSGINEFIGFILGLITVFISFELIPFAITIFAFILLVPTGISIFVPEISFIASVSNGFISGVGSGFFIYLLVNLYVNGYFTEEKDVFLLDKGLGIWKKK